MRLQVSRSSDLAVRALLVLDKAAEQLSGGELAARIGTTPGFLPQILQPLLRGGQVGSTKGPGGGYSLTIDLGEVTLLDVVEAVEGPTDTGECVLAARGCSGDSPCALHEAWSRAREALLAEMRRMPLSDLHLTGEGIAAPAIRTADPPRR